MGFSLRRFIADPIGQTIKAVTGSSLGSTAGTAETVGQATGVIPAPLPPAAQPGSSRWAGRARRSPYAEGKGTPVDGTPRTRPEDITTEGGVKVPPRDVPAATPAPAAQPAMPAPPRVSAGRGSLSAMVNDVRQAVPANPASNVATGVVRSGVIRPAQATPSPAIASAAANRASLATDGGLRGAPPAPAAVTAQTPPPPTVLRGVGGPVTAAQLGRDNDEFANAWKA